MTDGCCGDPGDCECHKEAPMASRSFYDRQRDKKKLDNNTMTRGPTGLYLSCGHPAVGEAAIVYPNKKRVYRCRVCGDLNEGHRRFKPAAAA